MGWAIVLCKFQCLFDGKFGKVLVPEGHNFALGNEKSKLVLASLVELADLNAFDFGSDVGGDSLDGGVCEQVRERLVGIFAVLNGSECFQWRIRHIVPVG